MLHSKMLQGASASHVTCQAGAPHKAITWPSCLYPQQSLPVLVPGSGPSSRVALWHWYLSGYSNTPPHSWHTVHAISVGSWSERSFMRGSKERCHLVCYTFQWNCLSWWGWYPQQGKVIAFKSEHWRQGREVRNVVIWTVHLICCQQGTWCTVGQTRHDVNMESGCSLYCNLENFCNICSMLHVQD